MKQLLISATIFILCGCGGGGSEQSNTPQSTAQSNEPTPQVEQQLPATNESNLLADNPANEQFTFSQFSDHTLIIEPTSYGFSADQVYVKVYTAEGNILFLGKVTGVLNLSLYVENVTKKVFVDMFSTVSGDPQITREFSL
jgi:hypothetical protein